MSNYLYAEVNVVSTLILLLIYFSSGTRRTGKGMSFDQTMFDYLIISNVAILITDAGIILCNGHVHTGAIILNYFFSSVYYALQPIFCCLWAFYCDYNLYNDFERIKKRALYYALPAIIFALLSALSIFTGWLFIIDSANMYNRGTLFFITPTLCFGYAALVVYMIVKSWKADSTHERVKLYRTMLLFPCIIVAASIIQIIFYGISLIWVASSLSILAVYLNLQNKEVYIDALTGLYNRRYIEQYLLGETGNMQNGVFLGLLMIDIDDYKLYNERFGQTQGDRLLRDISALLGESIGKNDFLARYGGDEFVVVLTRENIKGIDEITDNIHYAVADYTLRNEYARAFGLSVAVGRSLYGENGSYNVDAFVQLADTRMFEEKQANKMKKRQPS